MNQDIAKMAHASLRCIVGCFIARAGCVYDADKDPHTAMRPDHATSDSGLPGDEGDHRAIRIRASKAYAAGVAAITQEPISSIGDVWVLSLRTYLDRYQGDRIPVPVPVPPGALNFQARHRMLAKLLDRLPGWFPHPRRQWRADPKPDRESRPQYRRSTVSVV